jgi:NTE family protein
MPTHETCLIAAILKQAYGDDLPCAAHHPPEITRVGNSLVPDSGGDADISRGRAARIERPSCTWTIMDASSGMRPKAGAERTRVGTMTAHPRSAELAANMRLAGQKAINLALQGGGSHSAFTWGVLDRLLEDERLTFDGISATSAGCVNAVLLADGLASGGRQAAKDLLKVFWRKISDLTSSSIIAPSLFDKYNPTFGLEYSPGYLFVDMVSRFISPYQLNPLDINPLRDLLNEVVNFERVRQQQVVKLFLSASKVRTGKVVVFTHKEITADHVLASACLPFRMRAPEIAGEYYWDGGFMGNPVIFPVIYGCDSCDILLVHLTPAERAELPMTSQDILDRIEEISFNAALMREMRVITQVTKLIDEGQLSGHKRLFMHSIDAEDITKRLAHSSKMNGDWRFLMYLFELGRERADTWLAANFDHLGVATTFDLQSSYF